MSIRIVATVLSLATATALASDLDAPLVKKEPTVRSELERGRRLAVECAAILDLASHDRCLDRIENTARTRNELNDPLYLGIAFGGLLGFDMVYDVSAARLRPTEANFAKSALTSRAAQVTKLQGTLNIGDDDLCGALLKNNMARCKELLSRWR